MRHDSYLVKKYHLKLKFHLCNVCVSFWYVNNYKCIFVILFSSTDGIADFLAEIAQVREKVCAIVGMDFIEISDGEDQVSIDLKTHSVTEDQFAVC